MLKDIPILTESGVSAKFGSDARAMLTAEGAFLEHQAHQRLKRAEATGGRPMKHVCPGDLVVVWRKMTPKQERVRPFRTGRFVGPCRVLAVETCPQRGRAKSQQHCLVVPPSNREEACAELQEPVEIPWTISKVLDKQTPHAVEDVTADVRDMPVGEHAREEAERERGEFRLRRRVFGKRKTEGPETREHAEQQQGADDTHAEPARSSSDLGRSRSPVRPKFPWIEPPTWKTAGCG